MIEFTLCGCGCGAQIATKDARGRPRRFLKTHHSRSGPVPQDFQTRFEKYIEKTETCWLWRGGVNPNGYGIFHVKAEIRWLSKWAHRVSYELYKEPLEAGDTVDHLCFTPLCVNPGHLEAVSIGENSRRSPRTLTGKNVRKTHCPQEHPYSGENLFYDQEKRRCRICVRAKNRRAYACRQAEKKVIESL